MRREPVGDFLHHLLLLLPEGSRRIFLLCLIFVCGLNLFRRGRGRGVAMGIIKCLWLFMNQSGPLWMFNFTMRGRWWISASNQFSLAADPLPAILAKSPRGFEGSQLITAIFNHSINSSWIAMNWKILNLCSALALAPRIPPRIPQRILKNPPKWRSIKQL